MEYIISEPQILRITAGWYVGRTCCWYVGRPCYKPNGDQVYPYDRLSGYYATKSSAQKALDNESYWYDYI